MTPVLQKQGKMYRAAGSCHFVLPTFSKTETEPIRLCLVLYEARFTTLQAQTHEHVL